MPHTPRGHRSPQLAPGSTEDPMVLLGIVEVSSQNRGLILIDPILDEFQAP